MLNEWTLDLQGQDAAHRGWSMATRRVMRDGMELGWESTSSSSLLLSLYINKYYAFDIKKLTSLSRSASQQYPCAPAPIPSQIPKPAQEHSKQQPGPAKEGAKGSCFLQEAIKKPSANQTRTRAAGDPELRKPLPCIPLGFGREGCSAAAPAGARV